MKKLAETTLTECSKGTFLGIRRFGIVNPLICFIEKDTSFLPPNLEAHNNMRPPQRDENFETKWPVLFKSVSQGHEKQKKKRLKTTREWRRPKKNNSKKDGNLATILEEKNYISGKTGAIQIRCSLASHTDQVNFLVWVIVQWLREMFTLVEAGRGTEANYLLLFAAFL